MKRLITWHCPSFCLFLFLTSILHLISYVQRGTVVRNVKWSTK